MTGSEKRRARRLGMRIPVRIHGWDASGAPWPAPEIGTTDDVSATGCSLTTKHPLATGQVLHLSLPLPRNLRAHDLDTASYPVYAVVRHVRNGRAGILFLGRQPPRHFAGHTGERYFMPGDATPAGARPAAHPVVASVRLRRLNVTPGPASEEITVTEGLSTTEALLRTSLPVQKGEPVEISEIGGTFHGRALVQSVSIGKDNIPRLTVSFTEADAEARTREWLRRLGIALPPPVKATAAPEPTPTPPILRPAATPPPSIPPITFGHERFAGCASGRHGACPAYQPLVDDRRVLLCACSCHEPGGRG